MLQEQQEGEIKSSCLEKKVMVEEKVPCKVESEDDLGFPGTPTELLQEKEKIYRRLNIPWLPNEMQTIVRNKTFDLEKREFTKKCKTI